MAPACLPGVAVSSQLPAEEQHCVQYEYSSSHYQDSQQSPEEEPFSTVKHESQDEFCWPLAADDDKPQVPPFG